MCSLLSIAYNWYEWPSVAVSFYSKPQCCDVSIFAGLAFMDRLPLWGLLLPMRLVELPSKFSSWVFFVVGFFWLVGWVLGRSEGLRLKSRAFVCRLPVQLVIIQLCLLAVSVMNTIVTCLAERNLSMSCFQCLVNIYGHLQWLSLTSNELLEGHLFITSKFLQFWVIPEEN